MLVIGDREIAGGQVAVRLRSGENLGPLAVGDFKARIAAEIATRAGPVS
jgi:threonyl-tRNA synthetase